MPTEETATFGVNVEADAKAPTEAAAALEHYRAKIEAAQESVKAYGQTLRSLRGSSDAVTAAKKNLKAEIDVQRGAISKATLEIGKLGTTYSALAKKAREGQNALKGVGDAVKQVGGPVGDLSGKVESLGGLLKSALANPMVLAAIAIAATVLVLTAFTVAIVAGATALGKFALESANALRSMSLMREATSGASNAEAWGTQIEELGRKVPQTRDELNKLAVDIDKAFRGQTKISGQGFVDTMNLVAQSAAAMGEDVGKTLQGIIERGKRFGRVGINPFELQGTGLKFGDIASQLQKNLHAPIADVNRALMMGTVNVNEFAKAMRQATEIRFGAVNAKKMLDLDVIMAKFKDHLTGLFEKLSKSEGFQTLLSNLSKLADQFDVTTPSGQALADAFSALGDALGLASTQALPSLITDLRLLVLWALQSTNALLDMALAGDFDWITAGTIKLPPLKTMLTDLRIAADVLAGALVGLALRAMALPAAFNPIALLLVAIIAIYSVLWDMIKTTDWAFFGTSIVQGISDGVTSAWDYLRDAIINLGKKAWASLKDFWKTNSPSQLAFGLGANIGEGKARGIESKTSGVEDAAMSVSTPAAGAMAGAGGGGASSSRPTVNVVFNLTGSGDPQKTAQAIQSPSVLDAITYAITTALRSAGTPTGTPVAAGG